MYERKQYRKDRKWSWWVSRYTLAIEFYQKVVLSFLCQSSLSILHKRFLYLLVPQLTTDQSCKRNKRGLYPWYFCLTHFILCFGISKSTVQIPDRPNKFNKSLNLTPQTIKIFYMPKRNNQKSWPDHKLFLHLEQLHTHKLPVKRIIPTRWSKSSDTYSAAQFTNTQE